MADTARPGNNNNMTEKQIIENIRKIAAKTLPVGAHLYLYGSRARGNAHSASDWDLLILLNKEKMEATDYDITYPFREFGWDHGEDIMPHISTISQWQAQDFSPFYKNVEHDKIVLI